LRVVKEKLKRQKIRTELYDRLAGSGVSIPETIKQLRRILSMNQTQFAEKMEISLSALRRIEQGHGNFNWATLNKILEQFDLNVVVKSDP